MKSFLLFIVMMLSFSAFAQYDITATCGEVRSAGNGRILRRLQPSFFGLNAKYGLKTKFENYVELSSAHFISDAVMPTLSDHNKKVITFFSDKTKFKKAKAELKESLKASHTVWACVGNIDIALKYKGRHAYVSTTSLEDAIAQFKKQVKRHSGSIIKIKF